MFVSITSTNLIPCFSFQAMPCFVILASVCGPPAAALGLPWPTGSLQQPVSCIMSIKGIHQELGGQSQIFCWLKLSGRKANYL